MSAVPDSTAALTKYLEMKRNVLRRADRALMELVKLQDYMMPDEPAARISLRKIQALLDDPFGSENGFPRDP